jgi:peptide-methionine (S)-S-oxide reductase
MKNESVVLGGGCFWCIEAVFNMLKGIIKTTPGYAGGVTKNPSYEEVCAGDTGHAEVLLVEYNKEVISMDKILDVFFEMHDPTSINKQGADLGSQYRSIILYNSESQKVEIMQFIDKVRENFDKPIVTEIKKLDRFYPAEEYHKEYYKNNRLQPYCVFVIRPKMKKIDKEFKNLMK